MPIIQPEMNEVRDVTAPLPPGTYSARIVDVVDASKTVKGVTSKCLKMTLEIFNDSDWNGKWIFDNVDYTGKHAYAVAKYWLAATGNEYEKGTPLDTDAFHGKELTIVVNQTAAKDGSGKVYSNVKDVKALS